MCGRFINLNNLKKINRIFELKDIKFDDYISYNIAPSQNLNVLTFDSKIKLEKINWGLKYYDKNNHTIKTIINSRLETIKEKMLFKESFYKRRCIIPANGYYEWKREKNFKQPFFINANELQTIFFAGIWSFDKSYAKKIKNFSIITKSAIDSIKHIHNRMPVIFSIEEAKNYLLNNKDDILNQNFESNLEKDLDFFKVSTYVNSPINNSKKCIIPIN